MTFDGHTFVRTTSHRSRARLKAVVGATPTEFFSWEREGSWALVPDDKLKRALEITGVSLARKTDDLRRCISFNGAR